MNEDQEMEVTHPEYKVTIEVKDKTTSNPKISSVRALEG